MNYYSLNIQRMHDKEQLIHEIKLLTNELFVQKLLSKENYNFIITHDLPRAERCKKERTIITLKLMHYELLLIKTKDI